MHQQDAAHTLTDIFVGVEHRFAGFQLTGIDPEERQLTDVGIGCDLKGEGGEGCVVIGRTRLLLLGLGVDARDRGFVQR